MLSLLLLILIWAPCLSFKLIFALETKHRTLSLWTIIFIWAPGLIFNLFFTIILQHFYGPSIADWTSSDQRSWHLHHQGEPAYISSDVLGIEKPHWILWLVVLITVVTICFSHSRFPQQAKEGLFYFIVANMLFIRCLSTFPGITHYEESMLWFWFPWDTRSPLKGLILTSFVKLRLWDRLWLGAYSDSSHDTTPTNLTSDDAPSISSHDATLPSSHQVSPTTICIGCAPYVKPSSSHEVVPPLCFGCGFRNLVYLCDVLNLGSFYHGITNHYKPVAWRDAMIRLAFYYVLDSIVVVLQLRFSYPYGEGAPYTSYVNNSEIATWVLILQVSIWKSFRMQERFLALLQKEKVKEKVMTEEC